MSLTSVAGAAALDRPVHLLDNSAPTTPARAVPTGVTRIGAAPKLNPDGSIASAAGPKKAAVAILDTGS